MKRGFHGDRVKRWVIALLVIFVAGTLLFLDTKRTSMAAATPRNDEYVAVRSSQVFWRDELLFGVGLLSLGVAVCRKRADE